MPSRRALIDDLDVSMYGSKMGILHGTSGQWLLNVTDSPSLAYHAIYNFTKISCEFSYLSNHLLNQS